MSLVRRAGERLGSTGRVVTAVVLLLVVAFTVGGIVALRTLEGQLVERLDRQLLNEARTTRTVIDALESDSEFGDARRPSSSTALIIRDADGRRIYADHATENAQRKPLPKTRRARGAAVENGVPYTTKAVSGDLDYRAVTVPTAEGETVLVAAPLDGVESTVDTLGRRLMLIGVITLAILALLIWAVVAHANRQLDHLVDTAARIGAGDLSARVRLAPGTGTAARLGDALNEMLHQLETAFAAREASEARLRRFAADASHELRTPLTHIRGYAELLRSGALGSAEERTRAIVRIEAEAQRMTDLVEDLLLLARLDQQRPLELEPVDLRALVSDGVADARATERERPVALSLPEVAVVVLGDEARLRQVLANLLANIRMHTPPTTPARISLTSGAGAAILRIDDDGPGMSAEAATHAFDRFFRPEGARTRTTGGSGLGLAITDAIVKAHGGTITLDTAPGTGTHVTVTLPKTAAAASQSNPSNGP